MKQLKILYKKSLKMSPGKIAAQAVHAAIGLGAKDPMMSVVVLGVSNRQFNLMVETRDMGDEKQYVVEDAGYTEVPKGTKTCVAFYEEKPMFTARNNGCLSTRE